MNGCPVGIRTMLFTAHDGFLVPDPPRVVGSMSESPCHAVTISGFFSKSAKFFQTLMAPSSRGGDRQN